METPENLADMCKKRKRLPQMYPFHTFSDPGYPIAPTGPFRDNIRFFLQHCADLEEYRVDGMPVRLTFLVHENRGFIVPLYTIQEDVKDSFQPYCDQCRCSGDSFRAHLVILLDFSSGFWGFWVNFGASWIRVLVGFLGVIAWCFAPIWLFCELSLLGFVYFDLGLQILGVILVVVRTRVFMWGFGLLPIFLFSWIYELGFLEFLIRVFGL